MLDIGQPVKKINAGHLPFAAWRQIDRREQTALNHFQILACRRRLDSVGDGCRYFSPSAVFNFEMNQKRLLRTHDDFFFREVHLDAASRRRAKIESHPYPACPVEEKPPVLPFFDQIEALLRLDQREFLLAPKSSDPVEGVALPSRRERVQSFDVPILDQR